MYEVDGPRDWPLVFWRLEGRAPDTTGPLGDILWLDKSTLLAGLEVC